MASWKERTNPLPRAVPSGLLHPHHTHTHFKKGRLQRRVFNRTKVCIYSELMLTRNNRARWGPLMSPLSGGDCRNCSHDQSGCHKRLNADFRPTLTTYNSRVRQNFLIKNIHPNQSSICILGRNIRSLTQNRQHCLKADMKAMLEDNVTNNPSHSSNTENKTLRIKTTCKQTCTTTHKGS